MPEVAIMRINNYREPRPDEANTSTELRASALEGNKSSRDQPMSPDQDTSILSNAFENF